MNSPAQQPAIALRRFIVTNCILELPGPLKFETVEKDLLIDVSYTSSFHDEHSRNYMINFEISLFNELSDFSLKVKASGMFATNKDITDDFKASSLVKNSSPAIVFPFVRSFINNLLTSSGLPNFILPAFNFAGKFKSSNEEE